VFDHEVSLRLEERVTIIHGPNGYGKTSLLRLVHSLCQGSLQEVGRIPFQTFIMSFEDGRRLEVQRTGGAKNLPTSCRLRLMSRNHILASTDAQVGDITTVDRQMLRRSFPFLRQINEDYWEDTSDGELISNDALRVRFNLSTARPEKIEWFSNLMEPLNVKLIETSRLTKDMLVDNRRRRVGPAEWNPSLAVQKYASDLSSRIKATLANYAERAQRLDQSFPIRLLELNRIPSERVSSDQISERIKNLEKKRARLRDAGLLEQDEKQEKIPTNIDDSVQGVLSMYIKDVEEKLTGFDEILTKIELLQQILSAHFSFKRLRVSKEDGFAVYTDKEEALDVARLSSGEQHLIVLVYELLFTDRPDSLILIDEPEISLHVEWQLAFLSDLQQIAKVASHDVILATHSPQIVNDRLDLLVPFNSPTVNA
jgi:predicted ATP-binding protein involved in virulence